MLRRWTLAVLTCATLAAVVLLCAGIARESEADALPAAAQSDAQQKDETQSSNAQKKTPARKGEGSARLFSGVTGEHVTALIVHSEDRSFEFLCGEGSVSVNGQMADDEVFSTLMEQILTLPVMACDPFSPEGDAVLTLILTANGADWTASFYQTESQEMARVISRVQEETLYGQVKSWRIGTLLMACDGTRIQDESGNETPAQ